MSYQVSERRGCGVLRFERSTIRYRSVAEPQVPLRLRLKELAAARVGYGYRRLHVLLQREGWPVNPACGKQAQAGVSACLPQAGSTGKKVC